MKAWPPTILAAALVMAHAACAQEASPQASGEPAIEAGKLHLSAVGEVAAAPDMARVTAGVVAQADTASDAMAEQRTRMTAVMAALEEAGIASADIQTTGLDLSPVYARYDRDEQEPRIIGYRASNRVAVVARELDQVGPTLDALVEAGANTINSIAFDIEDSDKLLNQARRAAVAVLLERAELYADAAGVRIGRILEMSESGGFAPVARFEMTRAVAADASTPVSGGELTLSITVNATFEISQ